MFPLDTILAVVLANKIQKGQAKVDSRGWKGGQIHPNCVGLGIVGRQKSTSSQGQKEEEKRRAAKNLSILDAAKTKW